jgi:hypothetical protein
MVRFLHCRSCGTDLLDPLHTLAGFCWDCREDAAREARKGWCIAPLHKSNYMLITDKNLLAGLNNKGGLVK